METITTSDDHQSGDIEAPGGSGIITRRRLIGAGVAGAGAAMLGACTDDGPTMPAEGEIVSVRVSSAPIDDPFSDVWDSAPESTIQMDGQTTILPHRSFPMVRSIRVRSVHDNERVAFRIEWPDADANESTVEVDAFRDACAVLIGDLAGGEGLRFMGTQQYPVTILQWKADWQWDVDNGVRLIDDVFPNYSVDSYPPLITDDPTGVTPKDYVEAGPDATVRLPGLHVGNLLSAVDRTTPVEKLVAYGFSTTTRSATQDALGRGEHRDGSWSVVLSKPLEAVDPGEIAVPSGSTSICAFALWSGGERDSGGRKSPSLTTHQLVLRDRHVSAPIST